MTTQQIQALCEVVKAAAEYGAEQEISGSRDPAHADELLQEAKDDLKETLRRFIQLMPVNVDNFLDAAIVNHVN